MRIAVLTAVATLSLLGACQQEPKGEKNTVAAGAVPTNQIAGAAITPVSTAAVSKERAAELFHERHEGMEQIGKATKAVRQVLDSGATDLDPVRSAAGSIANLAAKSAGWFPPGTGQDVLPKTRALPAIWQKPDDYAAKSRDFQEAANTFKAAVDSHDIKRIKASYAALGKSCKACHDGYRAERHGK